jgi:xylulokinase
MAEELGPAGYVPTKLFPNLLWLKENDRKRFEKVRSVRDVREYIGYLLTGVRSFDRRSLQKGEIGRICQFVGLDADALGEGHDYSTPIGNTSSLAERRLGISKGVPVLQAPGDTVCAAIGSGISGRGFVCDVTGSTEVVAALVRSDAKVSTSLFTIPHLEEGKAFLFMSPPLGFVFKWFVDTFYDGTTMSEKYRQVDREVSSVKASDRNPLFVPSTRTVGYSYRIEADLLGLGVSHTRAHMARSVMEGLAMRVRMALDGVRANGMPVERVRLSGGGANSEVWNQLRSDVFGVETELIQTLETSSLGAAMVAAVSAGTYRNVLEAEQKMVHATKSYTPRAQEARTYDSIYPSFVRKMEEMTEPKL